MEAVPTPEAGIERALAALGPRPRIAVLPQGPYLLATVRGEKRPWGAWPESPPWRRGRGC